ncbi:MAG: hypothetical protein HY912_16615 [Desulfomonile tiedjei]|uniref:Uncharacterized protein n=1 Tax=Desulfomonile tiedjei TaxID=2358 RepID=A0A9D6Z1I4_9BACT|nr:hypothetical protein [Desulfomonile tiedjei]
MVTSPKVFISTVRKVCNIAMARMATQIMLGKKLEDVDLKPIFIPHYGVKKSVFPFNMLPKVDPVQGPEMRSTGEVLGLADSFGPAFYKAQEATQAPLLSGGVVLISGTARVRPAVLEVARQFVDLGFRIKATEGTHRYLILMRIQRRKIGGPCLVKSFPPNPLPETSIICRNPKFPFRKWGVRRVLKVLEVGFGEELLTRSASPILHI